MTKHPPTPEKASTPWRVVNEGEIIDKNGEIIALLPVDAPDIHQYSDSTQINGCLIVKAVNSHEALVEACKEALESMRVQCYQDAKNILLEALKLAEE